MQWNGIHHPNIPGQFFVMPFIAFGFSFVLFGTRRKEGAAKKLKFQTRSKTNAHVLLYKRLKHDFTRRRNIIEQQESVKTYVIPFWAITVVFQAKIFKTTREICQTSSRKNIPPIRATFARRAALGISEHHALSFIDCSRVGWVAEERVFMRKLLQKYSCLRSFGVVLIVWETSIISLYLSSIYCAIN